MQITINNYKNVQDIKVTDEVIFPTYNINSTKLISYRVTKVERFYKSFYYLRSIDTDFNGEVFKEWGLDKIELAYKTYKRTMGGGEWPEFNLLSDLLRLIYEIFQQIESKMERKEEPKFKLEDSNSSNSEILNNVDNAIEDIYDEGIEISDKFLIGTFDDDKLYLVVLERCIGLKLNGYVISNKSHWEFFADLIKTDIESLYTLAEDAFGYKPLSGINEGSPNYKFDDMDAAEEYLIMILEMILKSFKKDSFKDESSININKSKENGKTIEVQRITPTIRNGEKRRGFAISGRKCKITTKCGYISNQEILR